MLLEKIEIQDKFKRKIQNETQNRIDNDKDLRYEIEERCREQKIEL